ncbi:MAG: glycoside hydrolase family 95 protein, partial [Rhodospirillales bacterium]|nr:glycoside hydrolase family 95 protein [Rhodospirillales bacterium]
MRRPLHVWAGGRLCVSLALFAMLSPLIVVAAEAKLPQPALVLHYDEPASKWLEALPVGNGRMGAMVFGGVAEERLQLNEDTIWAGPPVPETKPGFKDAMVEARQAWFEGDYAKAHKLVQAQIAPRISPRSYQPLGDLTLKFELPGEATNYHRQLDLDTA